MPSKTGMSILLSVVPNGAQRRPARRAMRGGDDVVAGRSTTEEGKNVARQNERNEGGIIADCSREDDFSRVLSEHRIGRASRSVLRERPTRAYAPDSQPVWTQ